jgi:hypothetical protein
MIEIRFYSKDECDFELQQRTRTMCIWNGQLVLGEWSEWSAVPLVTANDDTSEP